MTTVNRKIQTLRFWHYDPKTESHVKLSLRKDGDAITFYQRTRTDEGWASIFERYTRQGDVVAVESVDDGRDCDGRLTQAHEGIAHYWQLKAHTYDGIPTDVRMPKWDKVKSGQRDEYAEAMGY